MKVKKHIRHLLHCCMFFTLTSIPPILSVASHRLNNYIKLCWWTFLTLTEWNTLRRCVRLLKKVLSNADQLSRMLFGDERERKLCCTCSVCLNSAYCTRERENKMHAVRSAKCVMVSAAAQKVLPYLFFFTSSVTNLNLLNHALNAD